VSRALLSVLVMLALPAAGAAQEQPASDVRTALLARGAPADLADQVGKVVADAAAQGLPSQTLADKALEGWAKNAPPARVLSAVVDLRQRLATARNVVTEAGVAAPSGSVVAAAEQALARGMSSESIRELVRSAGAAEAASTGLMVAGLLSAQGMERGAAAQAVERAYRDGRSSTEVLELPSLAALMIARGMTIPEVTRRMLTGQALAVEGPDVRPPSAAPPNRDGTTNTSNPPPKRP
jgi:hypothetical protein